ncbi:helix-turn-helix transcriptional regulator [Arenivirga flava]|uniref:Transcriptional regulator n=1 Tax=Arenivirga flava TaxID=1930060 RepID=A0AA37UHU9_9MICO|nr:helix-turn-helix transcriptional regulator [Arenivirga flava]GMA27447.1 transcriptional regulator [Arenivirga flava]
MHDAAEVRDFLTTRRARLTPREAGLPFAGGQRRVPGLRREEVAMLAGVSVDYYTRLERGSLGGASDAVLDALARALRLDEAEREHLHDLARLANASPTARTRAPRSAKPSVRASLQRVIDAMPAVPAMIRNERRDLLALNTVAARLYTPVLANEANRSNLARFCFLDPASRAFFSNWSTSAGDLVASLRKSAAADPDDRGLTDLIGELTARSDAFAQFWAAHRVRFHQNGAKRIRHPEVGELRLDYESMPLPADPTLSLVVYTPSDDATADALALLASLAATERAASGAAAEPSAASSTGVEASRGADRADEA